MEVVLDEGGVIPYERTLPGIGINRESEKGDKDKRQPRFDLVECVRNGGFYQ